MGDADTGPIEDALRQPMLPRGRAGMILSCGDLRHVDDRLGPRLLCRCGEDGGGFEQPFRERIREVCASDATHGASHRRDVAQISDDDLGAERGELLGALIGVEHEGPHGELSIEQLSYDVIARRSMSSASARDQKCWCSVLCHKCCSGVLCHECPRKVVVKTEGWFNNPR